MAERTQRDFVKRGRQKRGDAKSKTMVTELTGAPHDFLLRHASEPPESEAKDYWVWSVMDVMVS